MAPKRSLKKPPLEVVSKVDGAWYDGDVSLEGSRVRVHFNGFGNESDEFWEGERLKSTTRIMEVMRLRSKQLQDTECKKVSLGMVVCANFKSPDGAESKYYDARVLMIYQSRHSIQKSGQRELCKCRFKLAWEAGPDKDKEVYLGCADISFIDPESVETHPVAHEVLEAARNYAEESEDGVTKEPEQILLTKDAEVNCADILSDNIPSENRCEGLFTSKDMEGIPDDIIQKVKNYNIFHELLGKEADELKAALDRLVMTLSQWLRSLAMGHLHIEDSERLQKYKFKNVSSTCEKGGRPVADALIPGLPDDLALQCLAKISHGYHGILRVVCTRWHSLIQSDEYGQAQSQEGKCGDWLFVLTEEPKEGCWTAYDPIAGNWHVLPPMPNICTANRHYGFSCVGVAKRLLVMGGYYTPFDPQMQPTKFCATNEVSKFDPFTKLWSQVATMTVPRCSFACAVIGRKVYVAGGCSSSRRIPLSHAEVYDPFEDRWDEIPPLPNAREDCVGVAIANLFYVIAGVVETHEDQRTVEVYDPGRAAWYSLPDVWLFSRQMPCPVTSMQGSMYALDDWDANTIKVYDPKLGAWIGVGLVPGVEVTGQDRRPKGYNFGLIGLRHELYVLGGKVLRWQPANGHWKKFDILRLNTVIACSPRRGSGEIIWRRVKAMGESRGAVLGCAVLEEES